MEKNPKSLFFEIFHYYLDKPEMDKMLASNEGEALEKISQIISERLHEDWRQNYIREKGPTYQHWRSPKEPKLEEEILKNREKFLNMKSEDGYNLFRIIKKTQNVKGPDGNDVKDENGVIKTEQVDTVEFDLMRMKFKLLTQKWKDANIEAARFATCLVKTCLEQGGLNGSPEEVYENFEKMANDVHKEWMRRESSWADVRLLFPYKHLIVKSPTNNEKDKDRAHVIAVIDPAKNKLPATTQTANLHTLNESIVEAALSEWLKDKDPELLESVMTNVKARVQSQNEQEFKKTNAFHSAIKSEIATILNGKESLSFDDLEKCAAVYYKHWKTQAKELGSLPKEYDASYEDLLADDARVNFKNVARLEIGDLVKELIKENVLDEKLAADAGSIYDTITYGNTSNELGEKIKKKNEEDFANFKNTQTFS